jgi:3-oxoacyl-[acyl-carrier protein] reductase
VDAAFATAAEANGPIEVLVTAAGITKDQSLLRMEDKEFAAVMHVNLAGTFRCARAASKQMVKLKRGRMVFIGSVVGLYGGVGQANYGASKAGLIGFARDLAREFGQRSITANVIAPGFIETDMTAGLAPQTRDQYLGRIPAGRFGQADDVAALAHFLASPEAGYINGAVLPVDGGLGMGH